MDKTEIQSKMWVTAPLWEHALRRFLTFIHVHSQWTIHHNHGGILYIAQWAQQSLSISAADIQTKRQLHHSSAGSQWKTTTNESQATAAHFAPFTAYQMWMRTTIPYSDGWPWVTAVFRTQSTDSTSKYLHISHFLVNVTHRFHKQMSFHCFKNVPS